MAFQNLHISPPTSLATVAMHSMVFTIFLSHMAYAKPIHEPTYENLVEQEIEDDYDRPPHSRLLGDS